MIAKSQFGASGRSVRKNAVQACKSAKGKYKNFQRMGEKNAPLLKKQKNATRIRAVLAIAFFSKREVRKKKQTKRKPRDQCE